MLHNIKALSKSKHMNLQLLYWYMYMFSDKNNIDIQKYKNIIFILQKSDLRNVKDPHTHTNGIKIPDRPNATMFHFNHNHRNI